MAKIKPSCCPNCNETHEKCADKKTCSRWSISYEVCIIFGTRPHRSGFNGAAISRR